MISMCDSSETLCFLDVTGFETTFWVILVPKSAPGGAQGGPRGGPSGRFNGRDQKFNGRERSGSLKGSPGVHFWWFLGVEI